MNRGELSNGSFLVVMTSRVLLLLTIALALLSGDFVNAKEPDSAIVRATQRQVSEEVLKQLAKKLDDGRFAVREKAQRDLAAAGAVAVLPVQQAARSGSLEKSTRAVNILLEWSGSNNDELRFAALQHLSELSHRPAEAELARKILSRFREQVALTTLVEAGAKIRRDPRVVLNTSYLTLQVVFGPEVNPDAELLAAISEVRAISVVSFYSTKVSAKALKSLETAQQIQRIEFYGTEVSDTSIARLKEKLPNAVQIDVRNSAQLGVRGNTDRNDGLITYVLPGSAAERAGLRANDVVTHVDGYEVRGFVHLTSLIAEHKAGEKATLTVQRPNVEEPFDLEVTFGRWGEKDEGKSLTLQELRERMPADFHISNHRR